MGERIKLQLWSSDVVAVIIFILVVNGAFFFFLNAKQFQRKSWLYHKDFGQPSRSYNNALKRQWSFLRQIWISRMVQSHYLQHAFFAFTFNHFFSKYILRWFKVQNVFNNNRITLVKNWCHHWTFSSHFSYSWQRRCSEKISTPFGRSATPWRSVTFRWFRLSTLGNSWEIAIQWLRTQYARTTHTSELILS